MGKYNVGDTAILIGLNMKGPEEVPVVRVGRTNVYIEIYGREMAFGIEYGDEKGNYCHHMLYTVEGWAEKQRRDDLTNRLHKYGLSSSYTARDFTTEVLQKLVDVLDREYNQSPCS